MYAHCLETQISTLGNEWVGRLRQEMADTAQQNLATVREVQQKAGIDMDALARDAGQAVLGVREEIGDLRRRTAAEVEAVRAAGRNTEAAAANAFAHVRDSLESHISQSRAQSEQLRAESQQAAQNWSESARTLRQQTAELNERLNALQNSLKDEFTNVATEIGATQGATQQATQAIDSLSRKIDALANQQAQNQQRQAPPQQQNAGLVPPSFFADLAKSIAKGVGAGGATTPGGPANTAEEDLCSEVSDDDEEAYKRRALKRLKRMRRFIDGDGRHFHPEYVFDSGVETWIAEWEKEASLARQNALAAGVTNRADAALQHQEVIKRMRGQASILYESAAGKGMRYPYNLLRDEVVRFACDLLRHQSYFLRAEKNAKDLAAEITKQSAALRRTGRQKALFIAEAYRTAVRDELEKAQEAKTKNFRASRGKGGPGAQANTAQPTSGGEPWRGRGGRGRGPPQPL